MEQRTRAFEWEHATRLFELSRPGGPRTCRGLLAMVQEELHAHRAAGLERQDQLPVYKEMTRRMHVFILRLIRQLSVDEREYVLVVTADGRTEGIDPVMDFHLNCIRSSKVVDRTIPQTVLVHSRCSNTRT